MESVLPRMVENSEEWQDLLAVIETYTRELSSPKEEVLFAIDCEMCKEKEATIYCGQDKAHLCKECDESHHSRSKLLMKHSRLPLYHSPFQFGFCQTHTSDRYECVCLECGEMLCQLCLLVGAHASLTDHPIVSTIEALRLSLTPPGGDFGEILSKVRGKTFFAVSERKQELLRELQEKHQLIVQAESNHWQLQQVLDKQLRTCLEFIEKNRKKRIDFLDALRREHLVLLTLLEWFQAFQVHARLSLSASLWLKFFRASSADNPLIPSLLGLSRVTPAPSVQEYVASLPAWITSQIAIEGALSVHTDRIEEEKLHHSAYTMSSKTAITSQFEWVPSEETKLDQVPLTALNADTLRENRMAARLEELIGKPQKEKEVRNVSIPFPADLVSIPVDNVKEFVMQTLAVLAESEARIPNLDFLVDRVSEEEQNFVVPTDEQPTRGIMGLPPPVVSTVQEEELKINVPLIEMSEKLKQVLSSNKFANAVSVLASAPSSERQELFLSFVYLFRDASERLEDLVRAICRDTVERVEASSFLVSGISMLVPVTAAFQLALFPRDSVFLDMHLHALVEKSMAGSVPTTEQCVNQFISTISMPSSEIVFPPSLVFLLATVHSACLARFSAQVSIGVVTGLFLARIVSPRLVFASPKSDTQPAVAVTLMTRYIHRIAGVAADLSRSQDTTVGSAGILTAVSQLNGLMMRAVLSRVEKTSLPEFTGGLSPRTAAARLDRKLVEYGSSLPRQYN